MCSGRQTLANEGVACTNLQRRIQDGVRIVCKGQIARRLPTVFDFKVFGVCRVTECLPGVSVSPRLVGVL